MQEGGAGLGVDHQAPVAHQAALGVDVLGAGQVLLGGTELPGQCAHGGIKGPMGLHCNRLRGLEHGQHLSGYGHRMPARCAVQGADGAVRVVARHQRGKALHLAPCTVHGTAQSASVKTLGHHVHLRAHERALAALHHGRRCRLQCGGRQGSGAQQGQCHGQAAPGQALGCKWLVHGTLL